MTADQGRKTMSQPWPCLKSVATSSLKYQIFQRLSQIFISYVPNISILSPDESSSSDARSFLYNSRSFIHSTATWNIFGLSLGQIKSSTKCYSLAFTLESIHIHYMRMHDCYTCSWNRKGGNLDSYMIDLGKSQEARGSTRHVSYDWTKKSGFGIVRSKPRTIA